MRRWLIEYPALIIDGWFFAYRVVITFATIACVSVVMVVLLLAALGIDVHW